MCIYKHILLDHRRQFMYVVIYNTTISFQYLKKSSCYARFYSETDNQIREPHVCEKEGVNSNKNVCICVLHGACGLDFY